MKDVTKFVLCALGGIIFRLLYEQNKEKIKKNEIELDILKKKPCVKVTQLKRDFLKKNDSQQSLFVQGQIEKNTELLKSTTNNKAGVYIKETRYGENNQLKNKSPQIKSADTFILFSNENKNDKLIINDFSDTTILPLVLEHFQLKTQLGVVINEDILFEGAFICVYGNVIWDKVKNRFQITKPNFFGISKDQIIQYIKSDQQDTIGFFLAIGTIVFGISAFIHLKKSLTDNKQQNSYQYKPRIY